jgi:hypothetical protein
MSQNESSRGTRDAVETGIDLAKHLGRSSWGIVTPKDYRHIRQWPEPSPTRTPTPPQPHGSPASNTRG